MTTETPPVCDAFGRAKLASEQLRLLCMMWLFAALVGLGVFRIVDPIDGRTTIGWLVLTLSAAYFVVEFLMRRAVRGAIANERSLPRGLLAGHALSEAAYPIVVLFLLMLAAPQQRFTALVSPGYAFLFILLALSVLRVDWRETVATGVVVTAGYAGLVAWAMTRGDGWEPPHPAAMYAMLTIALAAGTVAAAFVARQVQGYVAAAVREVELRRRHDRLKRDLEVAGEVQRQLLPQDAPNVPGFDIAAINRPADETGGDYYDWQQIGPRRIVFSLGDVTGHGVGPALVTAACRAYVRALFAREPLAVRVLAHANRLLNSDLSDGRFVTLALLDLDADKNTVRLLSAGHGPTLRVSATDGTVERIDSQGLPLGLIDEAELDEAIEFSPRVGDLIVLCSDGFFEPTNLAGEPFGLARLENVLREQREKPAAEIIAALERTVGDFIAGTAQPDDMTAIVIKRLA